MASSLPDRMTRPAIVPRPGVAGWSSRYFIRDVGLPGAGAAPIAEDLAVTDADQPAMGARRARPPMTPAYRTPAAGRKPSGLITFSTSAVAVCCCRASREVARARLHLVEQAHVLDRDHRLVGEGLDEIDLALRIKARRIARQYDCALDLSVAQQRHAEHPSPTRQHARRQLKFLVFENVGDALDPA